MTENSFKIVYKLSVAVLAVLIAIAISAIVLAVVGANVLDAFYMIVFQPLTSIGHISEVLLRAIPLCIVALGVCIAYRSGIINIGGEGQMAMGVIAFTGVALAMEGLPIFIHLPLAILAAILGGALWGFIPGILKAKLKVSELLSTVMLNYIAAQLYSLCLRTIYMDPAGGGTPMSKRLSSSVFLSRIGRTPIHVGLIFALILAVLVWLLMWKTTLGYKMRAAGSGARAARYGGINVAFYVTLAISISGAFAGLAGAVEIGGVHRRMIEGVTNGYGFAGVVVALFGGLHPFGIIPAAFFFGLMKYGVMRAASQMGIPANMVDVIQGITILVIVTAQMIMSNTYLQARIRRNLGKLILTKKEREEIAQNRAEGGAK